jgi:hypothetical protein
MENTDKPNVTDLRVRGVSRKLMSELSAIAKNCYGLPLSDFMKMKMKHIRDSYPENKRIYID